MKEEETFKQRILADVALIEAKLIRFKVRGMGLTATAKDWHDEQVEQLEQKIDAMNESLSELTKVDDPLQGDVKATIEKNLQELQALLEKTTLSFTTEPGVLDEHGNDDGPFPYGHGLSGQTHS